MTIIERIKYWYMGCPKQQQGYRCKHKEGECGYE